MEIYKEHIGKKELPQGEVNYYMIQKGNVYGVELVEGSKLVTSTFEYFTEDLEEAKDFIHKLCELSVTSVTLTEIIDDYMGK